jgi:drug/metabolite transporter (DMT)-like permease
MITIRYTQVVWTSLLALIIFRERITLSTILASILTLIGVICVAQPSFLFTKSENLNETSQIYLTKTNEKRLLGMFIALLCAFSLSLTIILTKKLLEKQIQQSIIMFHFILTTFIMLLIIQIHYWAFSKTNQQKFHIKKIYLTKDFFYATILATLQLIPMVLTQKSIKREHPSIISVVQSSDILFAIILDNIFTTIKSNSLALVGSTLVLTSIFIVGLHKLWQDRQNRTCLPTLIQENK